MLGILGSPGKLKKWPKGSPAGKLFASYQCHTAARFWHPPLERFGTSPKDAQRV